MATLQFVPNRGQWHDEVRFCALGDTAGWLHDDGFTLRFERWSNEPSSALVTTDMRREQSGCVVRTRFLAAQKPTFVPGAPLAALHNFFLGNDRERWRTDVPGYATVCMQGVLPGVDVMFRPLLQGRSGAFEYDLLLAPGAELSRFVARCEGVARLRIDRDGRLCAAITTPEGERELIQEAPIAWQDTPLGRRPLQVAFRLLDECTYGFVARDLDPGCAATVDPGVVWGTFLGGGATDRINALRWKPGVGIWVAGWAGSTDFPTTAGAYRTVGGADAFLARLSDNGQALQFATYLGGAMGEEVRGLDLGPGDTATVVGFTRSTNFPVTPSAVQPTFGGSSPFLDIGDGFVVRFTAAGDALLGATYLGGLHDDVAEAVVVDATGSAVVAGWTSSGNFPTTLGAWQPAIGGLPIIQSDGFVTKVSANAQSLLFSTYVGGLASEQLLDLDRDPVSGDLVVVGWSQSPNYPVTLNALRPTSAGGIEGVVLRLSSTGASAVFSTYLGGIADEAMQTVEIAPDGSIWLGGFTNSMNFPTTLNAPQQVFAGATDGLVCQLNGGGQTILFSTLLGGPGPDRVRGLDVSAGGTVVVGEAGDGFPVTVDALQSQFAGGSLDAFVTHLVGGALQWSTYLGGMNQDVLGSVVVANNGLAVVAGWSYSADFPIAPPTMQSQLRGVEDGIILKLDLVNDLGDSLRVVPLAAPTGPKFVGDGEQEALAVSLENVSSRDLAIESVRVLVAGAGMTPSHFESLRVFGEDPGQPSTPPVLVAGPLTLAADDTELDVVLNGLVLAPGATAVLRFMAAIRTDPAGSSVEVACVIVDAGSWTLHAMGAGAGPTVRVLGSGRVMGPVFIAGSLPGDADGDGRWTVADLRLQLARLGTTDRVIDCDGDAQLTPTDVALSRDAVLGRPSLVTIPALVRSSWITLRGVFPRDRSLQASLGGRSLAQGALTPREITLRIEGSQPAGTQDLVVSLDGRVIIARPVLVQ